MYIRGFLIAIVLSISLEGQLRAQWPYRGNSSTYTIENNVKVYSKPDTLSEILATLPFKSPIHGLIQDSSGVFVKCIYGAKEGYVKREVLAFYTFIAQTDPPFQFLVGGSRPTEDYRTENLVIYKTPVNGREVLDRYTDSLNFTSINVSLSTSTCALKGVDFMIDIWSTHGNSCPGVERQTFLVHVGNKITKLIQAVSIGEPGYWEETFIYLPIKLYNGKTLLVKNGIISPGTDSADYKMLQMRPRVPLRKLVVSYFRENIEVWDSEGQPMFNADNSPKYEVKSERITYYKWNGTRLKMIREVKIPLPRPAKE